MRLSPDRRLPLFVLLLFAAAASGWWLYRDEAVAPRNGVPVADEYDYSLSMFRLVEMDGQGALKHTLHAENLYHYPDREESTLARPQLAFLDGESGRQVWEIVAERGLILEGDRSVFLSGDVHIQYAGVEPNRDFEVFTDELHVWPDDSVAETADPVRIVQSTGVTRSIGMRAEFDARRIDLLSDVSGSYVP